MPRLVFVLFTFAVATACNPPKPWQHKDLAHPTMTAADLSTGMDGHVRAVSEGATGGLVGAGGGCGCN